MSLHPFGRKEEIVLDGEIAPEGFERPEVLYRLRARLLGAFGEPLMASRRLAKPGEVVWTESWSGFMFALKTVPYAGPSVLLRLVRSEDKWMLRGRWWYASHVAPMNVFFGGFRWLCVLLTVGIFGFGVRLAIMGEMKGSDGVGLAFFLAFFGVWQWFVWRYFRSPSWADEERLRSALFEAVGGPRGKVMQDASDAGAAAPSTF